MKIKFILPLLFQLALLMTPALTNAKTITHLVVFGDSLSDRGSSKYGGFNRYSNGQVWPEYLAAPLCKTCLQDYAWGGAKTNHANYNGFNWSGVLWQINQFKLNSDPEKTLFIIWAGENDLLNGDTDGAKIANNIIVAINNLVSRGAKNIAIFNLPDFYFAPAYTNKNLPEFKKFSPAKENVNKQIIAYNKMLAKLLLIKKQDYIKNHQPISLYLIDFSNFFDTLIKEKSYKNINEPWLGTYSYPNTKGYMWWDAWHPMTSVHQHIANYVVKSLEKKNIVFLNAH